MDGVPLVQGDVVSFYLYADDQGLGAELCSLSQSVETGLGLFVLSVVFVSVAWNTHVCD